MDLLELLEKKRTECGLTFGEFCQQLGIHRDHYRRLLRGEYNVGLGTAKKIEVWLSNKEAELDQIRQALMS